MATAFLVEMLTCNAFKVNVRGELVLNRRGMIEACPDTGFDGLRGAVLSQRAGDARAAWTDEWLQLERDYYLVAYRSRERRASLVSALHVERLADATVDDETHWSVTLLPALPEFAAAADELDADALPPPKPPKPAAHERAGRAEAAREAARARADAARADDARPRRVRFLSVEPTAAAWVDAVRCAQEKARLETEIKLASQAARVAAHAHAAEAIERERLRRVAEAPDEIRWALRRPRQEAVARSRQDVGYREA